MDWNWFFSSVAQSVAALVGIFAAFLITKIVGNQAEFARKRSRIQELISTSTRYSDALSGRYFEWYNERSLEEGIGDVIRSIEDEKYLSPEEYYEEEGFSPFMPRKDVLAKIKETITTFKSGNSHGEYVVGNIQTRLQLVESVHNERELIDSLITDIKHNIRLISSFLIEVEKNPESSILISLSIAMTLILFFFGIIFPLSFLPVDNSIPFHFPIDNNDFLVSLWSIKGWILISVSIIFTLIMSIFLKINLSLKYDVSDVATLRQFGNIEHYSMFLGIMNANINEQNTWHKKQRHKEKNG